MFAFCKLFLFYDSLEKVAGIDAFKVVSWQLPNKEYLIAIFKSYPFFVLPVNF